MAAISIDSPPQNAALIESLRLPFPILSDPDRTGAIGPYGLADEKDRRNIARPAAVVVTPDGEEALRILSRDYADRPTEDTVVSAVAALNLAATSQQPPALGSAEPGPAAFDFEQMVPYFRGARFAANAINAENSGTTTAERYGLEWQSDYKLSEISWVLGSFRYESDKFSAYDNQQTVTVGYGRKLIDTEVSQLVGEIGIGYRDAELRTTGLSESEAIVRGLLDYTRKVTDNTEFTNRFLVESGSDNTFIQNLAGLSVAMNDKFAVKLGFEYRNNSDVPLGVDDTDTITSANLVYNF